MSDREDAVRLAVLKVLSELLGESKDAAACAVRGGWRPSDRLTATIPGGPDIGTVTLANGKTGANVTDVPVYEGWVAKTHPEQIEQVTINRVRPDYTDRILSAAKQLGTPVDAETGEVVPGVTVSAGDPYPMVKLTDDAREEVAKAWRGGHLTELVAGLLAIEGGK